MPDRTQVLASGLAVVGGWKVRFQVGERGQGGHDHS